MCCIIEEMELVGEEALWDVPSISVARTRIFARHTRPGMQAIVYSMQVSSENRLAMILPLPVVINSGEDALVYHDLNDYPDFFTDLEKACFCERLTDPFYTLKDALDNGTETRPDVTAPAATLNVHHVGSYEASYVPTLDDFGRLDSRFRLPDSVWQQLPIERDYGFAVFQLKTEVSNIGRTVENEIHPIAFEFPTRDEQQLFFPTVHVHDRQFHDKADFDHVLYCQLENARAKFKYQRDVLGINCGALESEYGRLQNSYGKYQSIPEIPEVVRKRLENDLRDIEQEIAECRQPRACEVIRYGPDYQNEFRGYDWYFESREDIQNDIDIERGHGLVQSNQKVEKMVLIGTGDNRDIWMGDYVSQPDQEQYSDKLSDRELAFINSIPRNCVNESRFLQSYGYQLVDVLELDHGALLYLVHRVIDFGRSIHELKDEKRWFHYFLEVDDMSRVTTSQLEAFKSSVHLNHLDIGEFIEQFSLYPGCGFRLIEHNGKISYVVETINGAGNRPPKVSIHDDETLSIGMEFDVSLDIARAYIDMGDRESARQALENILTEGDEEHKASALDLLGKLR